MRTPRCEVDDLTLMHAKYRVNKASAQHRKMSIGTEPSVNDHDVARLQRRVDATHLRHVVSP